MTTEQAWDIIHSVGGVRRAKDIVFEVRFTQSLEKRDLGNRLNIALQTLIENGEIIK